MNGVTSEQHQRQRQQKKSGGEKANSIWYVKNDRKLIRCVEFMWMWDNNLYSIWLLHTHQFACTHKPNKPKPNKKSIYDHWIVLNWFWLKKSDSSDLFIVDSFFPRSLCRALWVLTTSKLNALISSRFFVTGTIDMFSCDIKNGWKKQRNKKRANQTMAKVYL